MAVMNLPAGTALARAAIAACTSFDGSRRFEPRVVAGAKAEQHDVIVIVDQTGHCGAAVQVDRLGTGAELAAGKIEPAVLDGDGRQHRVARVHGDDLAVDQTQIARVRRSCRPPNAGERQDHRKQKQPGLVHSFLLDK